MSKYTIPTDWNTDDLIAALLPPVEAAEIIRAYESDWFVSPNVMAWLERVEALRKSGQAEPTQPELLHVAERGAY